MIVPASPTTSASASVDEMELALERELGLLGGRTRARLFVRVGAVAADVAAITGMFALVAQLWFGDPTGAKTLNMLGALVPAYLVVAINNRCYQLGSVTRAWIGIRNAAFSLAIAVAIIGLVIFFLQAGTNFSRAVFGVGAVSSLVMLSVLRLILARIGRLAFADLTHNEVVIEDGGHLPHRAGVLVLDLEKHGLTLTLQDPEVLSKLKSYLRHADKVIVACSVDRRSMWATALKGAGVHGQVVAPELDDLGPLGLATFEGRTTLVVASTPLGLIDRMLKRSLDLALCLVVLPFLLPVIALVVIAIRLESRGAILFKQQRVGLGNSIFQIYKFRSMYVEQSDRLGDRSASRGDPRVTRVGRFIRATSIDEVPQLLNVLKGDMSIVGPRPHPLLCKADDRLFWDIDLAYWHRHAVKPGMTGLAQVRGYRGATDTTSDLENRLQADLEYLAGWSIWRDIAIIVQTFRVLVHRNAF